MRENLRKVEYKVKDEIKQGWFHCWEQVIYNNRHLGGIEDVEAYTQAIVENEQGEIFEVRHFDLKFIN